NDASMESMLEFLGRECPDAQPVVICSTPEVIERTHGVPCLRTNLRRHTGRVFWIFDRLLLRVPRLFELLFYTMTEARKLDLFIVAGTGILEEPSHRLVRLHWTLLLWCTAARLTGKKIAFVSIGPAPIKSRAACWVLAAAFRMADYQSIRD